MASETKRASKTARSVLVTGGSRGLGLAIAQKLVAAGYQTITLARSESKEVAAAIAHAKQEGQGALSFVLFDLGKIDDIPELVRGLASNSVRSTVSSTTPRSGCPARSR
jgi:NAD(P)-dependent dehydrogenase (short-subunit alcohol dehydrogenase family)